MAFSDNICARITQWRTRHNSEKLTRGASTYDSESRQKMSLLSRTDTTRYETHGGSSVAYGPFFNHSPAKANIHMEIMKKDSIVSVNSNNTCRNTETVDDSSFRSTDI